MVVSVGLGLGHSDGDCGDLAVDFLVGLRFEPSQEKRHLF